MRTLLIGYGNPSRCDDGVALHVLNALRARWGQPPLDLSLGGWDELGGRHDSLFLQQLTPDLAATLAEYDRVVFVDASLLQTETAVHVEQVLPAFRTGAISHHLEPASLLALAAHLYGRELQGWLVSVPGECFDFGEELSPAVAAAVPEAVERIVDLVEQAL
jgi:hydrogenase maturation protease